MNFQSKFFWLAGGVVSFLIVASIIGLILDFTVKKEENRPIIDNLNARIKAWWFMIAIFAAAFYFGKIPTLLLFTFVSFFAFREFITLTPIKHGDRTTLFICFFIIIPFQYYLIAVEWYGLFSIFIPVYAFLILPAITAVSQDTDHYLNRISETQWGIMVSTYCISHAPALLLLDIKGFSGQNPFLLFYLLLIVQMSDVLQYISGKLFGKTKIAPEVSPSKTVEGLIGGAAGAVIIGTLMWWITPFSPFQAASMSMVIVLMGFLGGLALSAVKRSLGVKDWGSMIEGHGGVLDRMDSVSFSAPIFFHIIRYFFVD